MDWFGQDPLHFVSLPPLLPDFLRQEKIQEKIVNGKRTDPVRKNGPIFMVYGLLKGRDC